jgi:tRNA (adenine37-N6)-methyltransferase
MENSVDTYEQTGGGSGDMVLRTVGIVRNEIKDPVLKSGTNGIEMQGEMRDVKEKIKHTYNSLSEIIIEQSCVDLLDGIEDYSHLTVLYWAHKVPESSRRLTHVHPMGREENPLMGIFSTCSPARPNPVLMTVVQLHRIEGNILHVVGLDAVDGSPVIDIKPYVMEFYPRENVRIPEWMRKIQTDVNTTGENTP